MRVAIEREHRKEASRIPNSGWSILPVFSARCGEANPVRPNARAFSGQKLPPAARQNLPAGNATRSWNVKRKNPARE